MPKWEIAIAVADEPEVHRKKEGDIIAFKPYPWNWGAKELDQHLVVIVDNMTQNEVVDLCKSLYENDEIDEEKIMDLGIKRTAKRKYCLPLDIIKNGWKKDLDINKVKDKTLAYQPLKEKNIVIDALEEVAIFKNKYTDTFKYSKIKKI